ncbi:hypothetical protein Desor_2474 [Desulfosporosinus orientis DSM 765]|uniref:DUF1129 family protein n=1 Tax=Desulfosporosinus orientis (strain ATCC 19365 / DSM 765 / NCIMB 8382 / VKM B-1628 / Singapore I) TaxID=768706 RepID=G7WGG1_DESOD|nr:hypothetical protein [Desulfosporosinus orientis]AET68038.1 hypothetical protein Desor_2474 [Desulfosporosinus orientis DSM 765]
MANQLEKLRKENNVLDRQLSKENNAIITDMVCYLRSSDLCDYDIEIIRKELTGMALETQLRNEKFDDVIGDDYKSLCNELMKNGRTKTLYEKTLTLLYILVYGVGTLYLVEILFSSTIINIFKLGQFTMPITSGFLISSLLAVVIAFGVYGYFTRNSFEFSKHNRKTQIVFIIGFTAAWAVVMLTKVFMGKNTIISINCIYPIVFLAIAFVLLKTLEDQYVNNLFKTYN